MKHKVKITETHAYYIEVDANSKKEALETAKDYYKNKEDNYVGVANVLSIEDENTKFKIIKDLLGQEW